MDAGLSSDGCCSVFNILGVSERRRPSEPERADWLRGVSQNDSSAHSVLSPVGDVSTVQSEKASQQGIMGRNTATRNTEPTVTLLLFSTLFFTSFPSSFIPFSSPLLPLSNFFPLLFSFSVYFFFSPIPFSSFLSSSLFNPPLLLFSLNVLLVSK